MDIQHDGLLEINLSIISIYKNVIMVTCRYGAIVMDDQNEDGSLGYTVLHNSSCQHAAPTFINLMNAAILRLATHNKNMTIQTRNHPLPMTESQRLQRHVHNLFHLILFIHQV
jgi:ATP-binding cassette subfamily A (ABC1) protein 3